MSLYGAEFLQNAKKNLTVVHHEPPDVAYTPQGFLRLATEENAEEFMNDHKLQVELGALVELYTAQRLKEKFPFLNLDGIVLGSYGVQNEGWFDHWALLAGLKSKTMAWGVEYVHSELIEFNFNYPPDQMDREAKQMERANHVIHRDSNGEYRQTHFTYGIVCCGAGSKAIADKLGYGQRPGIRSIDFPLTARKRYVYSLNNMNGPVLDFPFLIDPSGVWVRREGLGGNYLCGKTPSEVSDSNSPTSKLITISLLRTKNSTLTVM